MTPDLIDLLSKVVTPIVCNAIGVVPRERGYNGFIAERGHQPPSLR